MGEVTDFMLPGLGIRIQLTIAVKPTSPIVSADYMNPFKSSLFPTTL